MESAAKVYVGHSLIEAVLNKIYELMMAIIKSLLTFKSKCRVMRQESFPISSWTRASAPLQSIQNSLRTVLKW